jgi:NAD(P)-dependent dehydrogenase (short-subunit alcohol dehydrogenase family)
MSRRVVITGATSGLGREMAVQLGREGCRLALTGRRKDKLDAACAAAKAAGAQDVLPLLGGVTDLAEVKRHYAEIKARWGGLDWAVFNAGIGDSRNAREFTAENYRWTFETNVFGVANWIEAVLPDMLAQKSGVLAGIASLAAFRGMPNSGAYSASKAALVTMLESARVDLRGTGVEVVTVCPGFVKSELTDRNEPGSMPFLLETEDGARRTIDGIRAGERVVHYPWQLSLPVIYVLHNLPGFVYDRVAALIKRKKKPYQDPAAAAKP